MEIYLDTGNIEEIKEAASTGLLNGVTTNPSLIAKTGKDFKTTILEIIKIMKKNSTDFTVSAEVTDLKDHLTMIKEGRKLSKIDKHILVKVPLTFEGLKAVNILSKEKIRCNVTLCFSSAQALLAAKAGAYCVSPFVGRVDDEGYNGIELLQDIRLIFNNYNIKTKILGASIRNSKHVYESMKLGCDIITIPYSVFKKMYYNPLTEIGIKKFEDDWNLYQDKLKNIGKTL